MAPIRDPLEVDEGFPRETEFPVPHLRDPRLMLLDRAPLGELINSTTRTAHTRLNKLILNRLPLAVPPRTETASAYVSGLLHFATIYITFEYLWETFSKTPESSPGSSEGSAQPSPEEEVPKRAPRQPAEGERLLSPRRVYAMLQSLRIPGLLRSDRLRADLRALTGWSHETLEEQLREVAQTGHLSQFLHHIPAAVQAHPLVLIAYGWVFYMALFSGGRFIRAHLESAGEAFWHDVPAPIRPGLIPCQHVDRTAVGDQETASAGDDECHHGRHRVASRHFPLAFFHFATPRDGEDLKHEFKDRLAEADMELADVEREQIALEAGCIFENVLLVVAQMDSVCGTPRDADIRGASPAGMAGLMQSRHLRDSIVISRERVARSNMAKELDSLPPLRATKAELEVQGTTSESNSGSNNTASKKPPEGPRYVVTAQGSAAKDASKTGDNRSGHRRTGSDSGPRQRKPGAAGGAARSGQPKSAGLGQAAPDAYPGADDFLGGDATFEGFWAYMRELQDSAYRDKPEEVLRMRIEIFKIVASMAAGFACALISFRLVKALVIWFAESY